MSRIAVVGLGAMGRPIAKNLLRAGWEVEVWNRSPEPVAELVAEGARALSTPAEALQAGIVISMLADDAAFAGIFLDSDILRTAPAGTLHINMATVSIALAERALAAHEEHDVGYIAAPVFGRVSVAEAGNLNILAAGAPEVIERAQPVFEVIGARTWPLGAQPQQANVVKIIGNYLIASAIQALGEAASLAEHSGIDATQLIEVLTGTIFPGPAYSSYGGLIASRQYQPAGFTTLLGRKDLHLALDMAAERGVPLPVGELLRDIFEESVRDGHGADDWASIAEHQPRR